MAQERAGEQNQNGVTWQEEAAKERKLGGLALQAIRVIAIITAVFHLATASVIIVDPLVLRGATLLLGSTMAFLLYKGAAYRHERPVFYDYLLIIGTIGVFIYLLTQYKSIIYRTGVMPSTADVFWGTVMLMVLFEMTRRTVGLVLTLFGAAGVLYALFGAGLPGMLSHSGFSFSRTVSFLFSVEAVYGLTLGVVSTYVIVFVLFGAFMEISGGAKLIVDLAVSLAGRTRGGPAKIAVIASSLMGTISGSTIANVVTTGSFTIPLMKSIGYKPSFAGAVETAASSGGQIMPPIMGVAAFLMVEFLGIPYSQIVLVAIIPALLYYAAIYWQVHLEAIKLDLKGLPEEEVPNFIDVIKARGYLLIPLFVLLFALIVMEYSAIMAGIWGIIACLVVSWFKQETRMGGKKILLALEKGGRGIIIATAATATAGVVIGALSLTGLQVKLGIQLLTYTNGELLPTLIMTAIFVLVLSCGQPSVSAYIIGVAIAAPSLIKLGIPPLTVHMFVFYFSVFSNVTPPVAVASYVAAAIARAKPFETSIIGLQLSIAAFILPFLLVYRPSLMLSGGVLGVVHSLISAGIGVLSLGAAAEGWLVSKLSWLERMLLVVGAFGSLLPGWIGDLGGAVIFFGIIAYGISVNKKAVLSGASN
ncbi:hypothetical protein SY88_16625 [Clostridiales bacterium PH28_bin88]|nr:hypothetical protein SY88_16625 [Clostridiales bacterium PH28_bin88]